VCLVGFVNQKHVAAAGQQMLLLVNCWLELAGWRGICCSVEGVRWVVVGSLRGLNRAEGRGEGLVGRNMHVMLCNA